MSREPTFSPDLYRGTAEYYDRFRISYPRSMLDELVGLVPASGSGRLLDLACGTGQIVFAIAGDFAQAWAVDQEPDMIRVVREKARIAGAPKVRAVVSPAEKLDAPEDAFELVAIGNAFHRLRRDDVAANAFRWLQPAGCIALLWSSAPSEGREAWQRELASLLFSWRVKAGVEDRVPANWEASRRERPDAMVLAAAGFQLAHSSQCPTAYEWSVDALIGWIYSASLLPRAMLHGRAEQFEADLHREFDTCELKETIDFAYTLARRPT